MLNHAMVQFYNSQAVLSTNGINYEHISRQMKNLLSLQKKFKMNPIELTTTQFRRNQKKYLDMAAEGMQIILLRGKELFCISNISKEAEFDDKTKKAIENSRQQFREGKCTVCSTDEELKAYFDSL